MPIALYAPLPRKGLRVVCSSPEAQWQGIQEGMPLAEAQALSTEVRLECHDPIADREGLENLASWCQAFSPAVALEEAPFPEGLLLEVGGVSHLFGNESGLLHHVVSAFHQRGLAPRAALADTIGAAWGVAHFAPLGASFPGWICPAGTSAEMLTSLPIRALRLSPATVDWLAELGLFTVGELLAIPRSALARRLDPEVLLRIDQALGKVGEAVVPHRPTPPVVASWSGESPLERHEALEQILLHLIEKTLSPLASQGAGVQRFGCRLRGWRTVVACVIVCLYHPSGDAAHLAGLLQLQMEGVRLREPVTSAEIRILESGPLARRQQMLFPWDSSRLESGSWSRFVDRLTNRLGRTRVCRAKLVTEAQPELGCRYLPAIDASRNVSAGQKKRKPGARNPPPEEPSAANAPLLQWGHRPLLLQREPASITVVAVAPDGPPVQFLWQGVWRSVVRHWGPERIETGWWRSRQVRRDYYRVETATGERYWLFRRLQDGAWFLQGIFG